MQGESYGKIKVMGIHVGKRRQHIHKYVLRWSKFVLTRDPDNKFDANAILIELLVRNGQHKLDLGYVPRETAEQIAPLIDAGAEFKATFRIKIMNEKNGELIALYLNLKRL